MHIIGYLIIYKYMSSSTSVNPNPTPDDNIVGGWVVN